MMAKYRGVLMVPSVVEFESDGSEAHVTEQARRIARGMGKTQSAKDKDMTYEPKLMEVVITEGKVPPPEIDVVFIPEPVRA